MRLTKATLATAIAMAFGSLTLQANAIGVSGVSARSALYEPLRADLRLALGPNDDFTASVVKIASADKFAEAGIAYPSFAGDILISYDKDPARAKNPILRLRSTRPIFEPVVRLLLEARVGTSGTAFIPVIIILDSSFEKPLASAELQASLPSSGPLSKADRVRQERADKRAAAQTSPPRANPEKNESSVNVTKHDNTLNSVLAPSERKVTTLAAAPVVAASPPKGANLVERVTALEQGQLVLRQDMGDVKQKLRDVGDSIQALKDLAIKANTTTSTPAVPIPASANVTVPSANVTVPSANVTVPSANVTVPSANVAVPSANVAVPSANVTVPSANVTVPSATAIAPPANVVTSPLLNGVDSTPIVFPPNPAPATAPDTMRAPDSAPAKVTAPVNVVAARSAAAPVVVEPGLIDEALDQWFYGLLAFLGFGGIAAFVAVRRKKSRATPSMNVEHGSSTNSESFDTTNFPTTHEIDEHQNNVPDRENSSHFGPVSANLHAKPDDSIDELHHQIFSPDSLGRLVDEIKTASFNDKIDSVKTYGYNELGDLNVDEQTDNAFVTSELNFNLPTDIPSFNQPASDIVPALSPAPTASGKPAEIDFSSTVSLEDDIIDVSNISFQSDESEEPIVAVSDFSTHSESPPNFEPTSPVDESPLVMDFEQFDSQGNDAFSRATSMARSAEARSSGVDFGKSFVIGSNVEDGPGRLQLELACLYAHNQEWDNVRSTLKEIINDDDMDHAHPEARRLLSKLP